MTEDLEILNNASQRWIEEGRAYKDAINAWLDVIYLEEKNPTDPEPRETRTDLAAFVRDQVIAFNKAGESTRLRELFPPDNDPFSELFEEGFTKCVSKVLLLKDGRILCVVGNWNSRTVYLIEDDDIKRQDDVFLFGASADKKYIAKAYDDRIEIFEDWEGTPLCTLSYPKNYGHEFAEAFPEIKPDSKHFTGTGLGIESINVFKNGRSVLLTTTNGIFVVKEDAFQLLLPETEAMEEYADSIAEGEGLSLSYPNSDLSPDDVYISSGFQDTEHLIFVEKEGRWTVKGRVGPRSSYPHCTKFNYLIKTPDGDSEQHLALSSCHFASSATIGLPLHKLTDEFYASGYNADEPLVFIDEKNWVYSILPSAAGYYLGANNGYIWYQLYFGQLQLGYIHIGGTIMDMDISEDRNTMVVASYSGQIVKLEWAGEENMSSRENNRKDPYLVTNLPWIDTKRYVFWVDEEPMIW